MKNILKITGAAALALSLAACSNAPTSSAPASSGSATASSTQEEAKPTTGHYTLYNATGATVEELYIYETGSDKGENLAGEKGFKNAHAMTATFDNGNADAKLTVEFKAGELTGSFTPLSIEDAPITLIAEAARTGATEISFAAMPVSYDIYNVTGEEVTDLYIYRTGTTDKGANLIDGAKANGGSQTITYNNVEEANLIVDGKVGVLTLEFKTASGLEGKFESLSYEIAPISLIAEDARTGATQISFSKPE